jgi:hypothetical protein
MDHRLPAFAVEKGYPFVIPVSLENYPLEHRVGEILYLEEGTIHMNQDNMKEKLGLAPDCDSAQFDLGFQIGIVNKLIIAEHALTEAENQIQDMTRDLPFVPEDFGFELAVKPESIFDDPIRIYRSKFDSEVLLTNVLDEDNAWIIVKGSKIKVLLPCSRVALCVFFSLGIPVREDKKNIDAVSEPEAN